jgi:hypothetical protein
MSQGQHGAMHEVQCINDEKTVSHEHTRLQQLFLPTINKFSYSLTI